MPATQKNRSLAISTAAGEDALLLRSVSINEHMGRLFQIEAELFSEDLNIDFNQLVGSNVTVRIELAEGKARYFNGYISRFAQGEQQRTFCTYRATIVPWLWFLTRTSDCRIFQKKKVPDIIEEVFKAHGFKDYKPQLSGTYREWEYCVQYRETDFNFVSRLMEQEGIYYFFKHEDGKHTMVLADSSSAHEPFTDYPNFTFRPPTQEATGEGEFVRDWLIEKEVQPTVYALSDFNFKTPNAPIVVNANISRQHEAASFEMFDSPGEFEKRAEGDAYAKIRIQELQAQHELLRAHATVRGVAPGSKFTLKGHPRQDQNREYVVVGASHNAGMTGYEAGNQDAGEEYFTSSFTAIPAAEQYRSPRITPKPAIQGPQTAMVVGKKGEEIDTDEFGRVKVQFHWDRYGKVDENSSCWMRVAQSLAGKGWGSINIPRIGQEVIVEFLEGDPDHPIITGRVYNATATTPYKLPDRKTISGTKFNSSKGGQGFNELRFEDKKGEEQIFMHGEKNLDVRIKNDAFEFIGNDRHLIVKNDQIEHVEKNRNETVDADHMEKIGKDRHLKVDGKEAKAVKGSLSLTVDGDVIEVFKANHSEATTGDYFIKADNIVIEATTNITIKVGQSYIAIEQTGIKVSCPAQAEIEGQAQLTLKGGMVMIN